MMALTGAPAKIPTNWNDVLSRLFSMIQIIALAVIALYTARVETTVNAVHTAVNSAATVTARAADAKDAEIERLKQEIIELQLAKAKK